MKNRLFLITSQIYKCKKGKQTNFLHETLRPKLIPNWWFPMLSSSEKRKFTTSYAVTSDIYLSCPRRSSNKQGVGHIFIWAPSWMIFSKDESFWQLLNTPKRGTLSFITKFERLSHPLKFSEFFRPHQKKLQMVIQLKK